MSVATATAALTLFGLGGFFGQFAGGVVGQYLYNRQKKYITYLMGVSTLLGVLPMYYVLNMKAGTPDFYFAAILAG